MKEVELLVALLAIIGIVGAIAQRLRVSLPILLVIAGMVISLVTSSTLVRLEPETVFFIFLPPLIYIDAFNTSWKDLRDVADFITLQAVGLVLVTVVGVASLIHSVVPGMPWAAAVVLGAIVSPTDAIVAAAIAKEIVLPRRVLNIIKGESLINDATGLVAYQFAVAATVTGIFSWSDVGIQFLYVGVGGILVGLVAGWILSILRTKLDHRPIEIIGSLLSPFVVYLAAEYTHVSGVLSVVTAGLFLGWRGPTMLSPLSRLQSMANWETISYILNGFSFLLMGLQLKPILRTVRSYPTHQLLLWTLTAAFAPIIIRFVWTFAVSIFYAWLRKRNQPHWKHLFIVSWSGMRGILSMAAALALPLTCINGEAFPYRDLIIFLTVVVIASTLLVQGIALPMIVKHFNFGSKLSQVEDIEREARLYMSREAVRVIDQFSRKNNLDMEHSELKKILNHYLDQTVAYNRVDDSHTDISKLRYLLQQETIKSQRKLLLGLRNQHKISEELFKSLQNELDLEEAQLNSNLR